MRTDSIGRIINPASSSHKQKHGGYKNHRKTYQCWQDMKQRCYNQRHKEFKNYGARGICVCDRWLNSFENFYADMGEMPNGMSIDRIDNDAGYLPGNCRWANKKDQNNNQRRCVFITHGGETLTLTQWADRIGIHYTSLAWRLKSGWGIENALSTPKSPSRK